jgi:hypothetical protein
MHCYRFTVKSATAILFALLFWDTVTAQVEDPHITGNVPITFYGRVIDQNNQPVPGVKIWLQFRVGYFTSPTTGKERWIPVSLTTDPNGNFVLDGVKGGFVQFSSIEKEGYKLLPAQVKAGFMYYPRQFQADPNNPIIFKMWKTRGAEPLIGSSWHGNVHCDGTLLTFDLHSGKLTKDGGLQITCTRVPLDIVPRDHRPYDYELKIAVAGGGIQTTEDEFTYFAPESGYLPAITLGAKSGDPKWTGNVRQEFYIKTADGHYGRLSVEWYAELSFPTHFEWDCSINPSGSRNLER